MLRSIALFQLKNKIKQDEKKISWLRDLRPRSTSELVLTCLKSIEFSWKTLRYLSTFSDLLLRRLLLSRNFIKWYFYFKHNLQCFELKLQAYRLFLKIELLFFDSFSYFSLYSHTYFNHAVLMYRSFLK